MTTDKFLNQEEATQFLRKLGLKIEESVICQVIEAITSNNQSLYELYASGNRRDGSARSPVCGKGTADKIKRLYEKGKLDPYLSYLGYRAYIPDLDDLTANLEKKKSIIDMRRDLRDFISSWLLELSLPLNYLDNEDLSRGGTGVPHVILGLRIKWEVSANGEVVRRYLVEDRDEFKEIQKSMQHHRRLWNSFKNCHILGGVIIKVCNQLAIDIRRESEIRTGFKVISSFEGIPKKKGLDRLFVWTIYADALGIFSEKWLEQSYHFNGRGDDSCEIRWGDNRLAIVKLDAKDAVIDAHRKLRASYKESSMVKEILQSKRLLNVAETQVREELECIQQLLVL